MKKIITDIIISNPIVKKVEDIGYSASPKIFLERAQNDDKNIKDRGYVLYELRLGGHDRMILLEQHSFLDMTLLYQEDVLMRLKLICCEVFFRMAYLAAAMSKNIIKLDFTPLKSHTIPDELRSIIQSLIDETEQSDENYDAIILGYGLCGNATVGLCSNKLKLVIPRVHDCRAIFLGSTQKDIDCFKHRPSAGFGSHGYFVRERDYLKNTDYAKKLGLDKNYEQFVQEYGEENAKLLWGVLHPPEHDENPIYIRVEPFESLGFFEEYLERLYENSLDGIKKRVYQPEEVEIIEGSMQLMTKLIDGDWDNEFIIFPPGKIIQATYDLENVFG